MQDLMRDIAHNRKVVTQRVAAMQPWCSEDLPIEAALGTFWMRSDAGSVLEFYSWIDTAYCHGPLYGTEEVHQTQVTFHTFVRSDRAFMRCWDDFTIYDQETLQRLVSSLQRAGFEILIER